MTGGGHQWAPVFCSIAYANYQHHLPPEERSRFETAILVPLAHELHPPWKAAVEQILQIWSSVDSSEEQDYRSVVDAAVEEGNQRRRQTLFSKQIVHSLRRIFPIESNPVAALNS